MTNALDEGAQRVIPAREQPAGGDARNEGERDRARGHPDRKQDDRPLRITGHGGSGKHKARGGQAGARGLARQIGEKAPRELGIRRLSKDDGVVLDRGMGRGVEGEERLELRQLRIGRVDEARRDLPLLDCMENRPHIFLADQSRFEVLRDSELLEGCPACTRQRAHPRSAIATTSSPAICSSSARRSATPGREPEPASGLPFGATQTSALRATTTGLPAIECASLRKSIHSGLAEMKTSAGAPSLI